MREIDLINENNWINSNNRVVNVQHATKEKLLIISY
jgi:hypothetical protein